MQRLIVGISVSSIFLDLLPAELFNAQVHIDYGIFRGRLPGKKQRGAVRYPDKEMPGQNQQLLSLCSLRMCGICRLPALIQYGCKLYGTMPFHHGRNIIADGIITR